MVEFYFTIFYQPWQAAEDVNVTFEDQQKINKFARNTNRMSELKDEIEAKKVIKQFYGSLDPSAILPGLNADALFLFQKSLQNLEDASDDLMMCDDDAMLIPYQIGDVFISHSQEETQELLEAAKVMRPWNLPKTCVSSLSRLINESWVNWIFKKDFRSQNMYNNKIRLFQIPAQV